MTEQHPDLGIYRHEDVGQTPATLPPDPSPDGRVPVVLAVPGNLQPALDLHRIGQLEFEPPKRLISHGK